MTRTNLFKVFILYPVAFKAFYRLKVKPFTKELLIKELPLKKLSMKNLLLTRLSIIPLSKESMNTALSHQRFAGGAT